MIYFKLQRIFGSYEEARYGIFLDECYKLQKFLRELEKACSEIVNRMYQEFYLKVPIGIGRK